MSFIRNLKLRTKLFLGFGTVLFLLVNGLGFSFNVLSDANNNILALKNLSTSNSIILDLRENFLRINFSLENYVNTRDSAQIQIFRENYDKTMQLIIDYKKIQKDESRNNQIENIQKLAENYNQEFNKITDDATSLNNTDASLVEINNISSQVLDILDNVKAAIQNDITKLSIAGEKFNNIALLMLIILILSILFSVYITVSITKLIVIPITTVTKTFKNISEGGTDLNVKLNEDTKDEIGMMSVYFNSFITKLTDIINDRQNWLKTGQTELNERIRGELNNKEICDSAISYISSYVNAQMGVIYTQQEGEKYVLTGSFAVDNCNREDIGFRDGLIGQCGLERKTYLLKNIPADYIKVSSGLGDTCPKEVIIVPCIFNGVLKCIIELATLYEFTDYHIEFLEIIAENMAIVLNMAEAREKMRELLEETMQQSEELQVQQEELRQSNEELQEQTHALVDSEFKLQQQQEELRVANEELEEKNREYQSQQYDIMQKNEYLEKVQKEIQEKAMALEAANKYKSEFLANVSHELRTPLNSIMVLSQLLMQKAQNLTQKEKEYAATINSAGGDLLTLINDILDLAKVESGKLDVELGDVTLSEIAANLNNSFSEIALKKGLEFNINIQEGLPETIYTDGMRLQQILNNFLSNAFKFTQKGKVEFSIKRPNEEAFPNSQNYISFCVLDTGIGIPKDKQDIIFEAFKQSDGTINRKYGGTGLGLTISKQLADLLNGEIFLDSTEGKGSLFEFVVSEDSDINNIHRFSTKENVKTKPEEYNLINNSNSKSENTILIIEDDCVFQKILVDLAEEKGYCVLTAQDGETGLKLALEHIPDAILLDVGLPGINGYEVAEQLKNDVKTKNIPVHIISGKEDGYLASNKIVGYLKKPVSVDQLEEAFDLIKSISAKPLQKILIAGCSTDQVEIISGIMNSHSVFVQSVNNGKDANKILQDEKFDCLILDYELDDMPSYDFLSGLAQRGIGNIPVIIYTEKELSNMEEERLKEYSDSIIIRGSHSLERLEAETTIFLHGINKDNDVAKKTVSVLEKATDLQGKKILLVDDDMRNVFSLNSLLESNGLEVVIARNGLEGVNKFNEVHDIDLILMDIMMPEMDGYAAISQIRKEIKGKGIPIIALTAKAMKEDKKKCLDVGASDYLSKPVDIDKLISLLRVWLYK